MRSDGIAKSGKKISAYINDRVKKLFSDKNQALKTGVMYSSFKFLS